MLGSQRDRWTPAEELACLSGLAPVMERSGKSVWIRWRYFCPKFMHQSFHEYAGESLKHSFWARAYFEQQISKGITRQAAVRALAYKGSGSSGSAGKLARPTVKSKYLVSVRKKGSPLLALRCDEPTLTHKKFLTCQPQMACWATILCTPWKVQYNAIRKPNRSTNWRS